MNKEYLTEARRALVEFQFHWEALERPKDPAQMEREWGLMLHYADQIYQRLQHAAVSSIERRWLAMIKRERKSDPLLQYAHQARGVEHHGLQRITMRDRGMVIHDHGNGYMSGHPGEIVKLVPVKNRGRTYPVPDRLGEMKFNPNNMQQVARMLGFAMIALVQGAEHVHEHQRLEA